MRRTAVAVWSIFAVGCGARAPVAAPDTSARGGALVDPGAPPVDAAASFETMRTLAGEWEAATPGGGRLRVIYRLVSANSVLVETYGAGSGKETLTLFHRDGSRLLATHYCAQGNQPRLQLSSVGAPRKLGFTFVDATNLPDPRASHLVRLTIDLVDQDHFERREVYREKDAEEESVLAFTRVAAPPEGAATPRVVMTEPRRGH